jgi:hypothetical protein
VEHRRWTSSTGYESATQPPRNPAATESEAAYILNGETHEE